MAALENYQGRRLLTAAQAAFAVLADAGFRIRDSDVEAHRGASVVVASDTVTITVAVEWQDHELAVWVQTAGVGPVPVQWLVPQLRGTLRLPRDATRGVLQRRLERVVRALQTKTPEILQGGQPASERLLQSGYVAEG